MNKIKLFLFLAICAIICMSVEIRAEQVSEAKARSVAAQFMNERGMGALASTQPAKALRRIANVPQAAAAYYVFNAEKNNGFVVISGDDRTEQVLGYSTQGSFDPANLPDNMQAWLDQYVEEIALLDAGVIKFDNTVTGETFRAGNTVAPLLKSEWDQGAPFNFQCPQYNDNYCYTGCTATALAQVMYYYKWPTSTSQTIPGYTQTGQGYSMEGTTYAALPTTTFNWGAMKDYYEMTETSTTSTSNAAVAKLMEYCGKAMQMKYGTGSSGATPYVEVLVDYFRYSSKARKLYRFDYNYSQWQNYILNELLASRPVIYVGYKHSGGHTFVCDGYDGNGYYHFNWGWRGNNNGYFVLTSLNPKGGGVGSIDGDGGYMMGQYILIGLEPNTVSTNEKNSATQGYNLSCENTTYTRSSSSSPFVVKYSVSHYNESYVTRTYDLGCGVYTSDGFSLYQDYPNQVTNLEIGSKVGMKITRTINFGQGYPNGTYYLRPLCRESGSTEWLPSHYSGRSYFKAVINGNTLTITPVNASAGSADGFTASINSYSSMKKVNRPMEVKVKIVNNSSFCDYVPVYLFANGNLVGGNSTNITQGSTEYITICYTPTTAGDNTLKLTADASGNNVYCTGSVYVEDGAPADLTMTYSLPGANSSYQVVGDELSIKTNIKNNKTTAYNDYISVNFYKKQGASNKYSLQNTVTKIVNVPGSSTKNETFSFSDLAPGKYFAIFYYYNVNNKVEAFRTVAIELIMKGDVNGDGVITATDVTALYEYLLNGSTTNLKFGDQNGDGLITSSDVTAIYKILLGNVTK